MELQHQWSRSKTEAMDERGALVRHELTGWLRDNLADLASSIGIPVEDFLPEGRDGTGLKTRVPWARFGSLERSPSATEGFYVVYLFAFDGSAVYLSLNQGTTDFVNGEFVRKELAVLQSRVAWARSTVSSWIDTRTDLIEPALADEGSHSLGHGYELGNIAAIRYLAGSIPSDEQLLDDAIAFAAPLGDLYREHAKGPLPFEVPELVQLEDATDEAAGKKRPARGAGFRQSKQERDLIEDRAVDAAVAYYEADGWKVKKRGAPFDLELTRDGDEKVTVEVKGTTSMGEAVALTYGEVVHHAKAFPNNALVVVRGIRLDRSTSPPTANGGVLFERRPWSISDDALRVVSYRYTTPNDLFDPSNGFEAEDPLT